MGKTKTILVAPLHWGLGHATRCIPIIQTLLDYNFKVIIASDGGALALLRKEFGDLESIELPSYNITYPRSGNFFKWKMLLKLPKIKKIISKENELVEQLVSEGKIQGIISDNRLGVRSNKIPSAYITHQLNVLSGFSTKLSTKAHQNIINKFDECWVPDIEGESNLSGILGHLKTATFPIKYLGVLSRMKKLELIIRYDILVILSGPEPQRTLLEELLIKKLRGKNKSVLLVQGRVESIQKKEQLDNITRFNYMTSEELEKAINESEIIVSRSGYTTIMDLATLNKKAFFIPTPGQFEQEYLAKYLESQKIASFARQDNFNIKMLEEIKNYKGFTHKKIVNENQIPLAIFK